MPPLMHALHQWNFIWRCLGDDSLADQCQLSDWWFWDSEQKQRGESSSAKDMQLPRDNVGISTDDAEYNTALL